MYLVGRRRERKRDGDKKGVTERWEDKVPCSCGEESISSWSYCKNEWLQKGWRGWSLLRVHWVCQWGLKWSPCSRQTSKMTPVISASRISCPCVSPSLFLWVGPSDLLLANRIPLKEQNTVKVMGYAASQVALVVKNLLANAGDKRDMGLIPGSGRFPGEGQGNPLQYSCLDNPMDRGAWWAAVHWGARVKWLSMHAWWDMTSKIKFKKTVTFILLTCFLSVVLSLAEADISNCHVASSSVEWPTGQGTGGGLRPTASKNLRPSLIPSPWRIASCQQSHDWTWNWILPQSSFQKSAAPETLSQRLQLYHANFPTHRNCERLNVRCLKSLNFGLICDAVIEN